MSDDVWEAGAAALDEDFGPNEPGDVAASEVITVGNLIQWGTALLQKALVPLLIGGFAMWGIGFMTGLIAQFANIGGSIAGAAANSPEMAQALGTLSQAVVQLIAAPLLWVAVTGILTAAAKGVLYGEQGASAVMPSASSILAFVVGTLLMGLIQFPLIAFVGIAGGVGFALGGNSDEAVLYGAGAALVALVIILLPSIYLGLRLRFTQVAAVVEGSGIEGVKASWAATSEPAVLLHLFLFGLIEGAVAMVNILLCCTFGLLTVVTVPFFQGALVAAYLRYSRPEKVLAQGGFFEDL